jgi:hypothetical protein
MSQWILPALIWAFSFWMVALSVRHRASSAWIVVILLLAPYGGLAYLFYSKVIQPYRQRHGRGAGMPAVVPADRDPGARRPSEAALEVADQLEEQRRFGEAALIYRRTLEQWKDNPRAIHGLARSLAELDQATEALTRYEALMAQDPRYRNYSAALEYAEVLHLAGRGPEAIDLLEGLVRETGRLNHRLALAHYCELAGETARARSILREALTAYESAPPREREANRRWQRRIADKLEELAPN